MSCSCSCSCSSEAAFEQEQEQDKEEERSAAAKCRLDDFLPGGNRGGVMSVFDAAQLAEAISTARSSGEFDAALSTALDQFDRLNRETSVAVGAELACREGCSLCCWLRVDAFAHEIFLIARHVAATFSAPERAALEERLATHSARVHPLTPFEHATRNIQCPLLREGRCSVYEVRPKACRRHHSLDLASCEYCFDHPTDLDFPGAHDHELFRTLTKAMGEGIDAYASYGFDHTIYELGTALAEALRSPERWEEWKNRRPVFLTASVTPSG